MIVTSSGDLHCKQIFFIQWKSATNEQTLRESFVDLISMIVQNMKKFHHTSIALPAIGCAQDDCSVGIIAKILVREMARQLIHRNLSWRMKFVIDPRDKHVYIQFCEQLSAIADVKGKILVIEQWVGENLF